MNILVLFSIFAALFPLLIYIDYKRRLSQKENYDENGNMIDMLLVFSPFAIFFYTDAFWSNLLYYYLPLWLYFGAALFVAKKKGWCPHGLSLYPIRVSSGLVVVFLGYYLFFHDGMAADAPVESVVNDLQPEEGEGSGFALLKSYWAFGAIVVIGLLTLLLKRVDKTANQQLFTLSLWLMTFGLPVLPFFSPHYWWAMLATLISYAMVISRLSKSAGSEGGAYFAFFYFYLLAAAGSVILYAVLF